MRCEPIVIIGAPRSGTNMLRDLLVDLDSFHTWPCDEINYIWRYGNARYPSDELTSEMATPKIVDYIRRQFGKIEKPRMRTIEKTCANSLRVPFVEKILPEARYIFIVRDGVDVVRSSIKRWTSKMDIPYLARKARYVPFADLPYYSIRYFRTRVHKLFSEENRLSFWGPQLDCMPNYLEKYSLEQVCALQWKHCVESAASALGTLDSARVHRLRYEDIVRQPKEELGKILTFLGSTDSSEEIARVVGTVRTDSVGKGRDRLAPEIRENIHPLIQSTLEQLGYE
ncbi:MAG: sulfotransferase [Pseudomonadota bacterium]